MAGQDGKIYEYARRNFCGDKEGRKVKQDLRSSHDMNMRIYLWRHETKSLYNYAMKCDDKESGRLLVPPIPKADMAFLTQHNFENIFDKLWEPRLVWLSDIIEQLCGERVNFHRPRTRKIIPHSFLDHFTALPVLPTYFDRAHEHSKKHSGDYYKDVRELTQKSDVYFAAEEKRIALETNNKTEGTNT